MAMPRSPISKADRQRAYAQRPEVNARIREYKRGYYQRNRLRSRLAKFGLSAEDYVVMLERQDHHCVICPTKPEDTRDGVLHVDHDHETGMVRGLLCHSCNVGLGHFRDNPALLQAAINYLLDRRM